MIFLFSSRYRRIGYNLNVMRQSACLVFNPVTVDTSNYAAFINTGLSAMNIFVFGAPTCI